jgi:hypothetical protein
MAPAKTLRRKRAVKGIHPTTIPALKRSFDSLEHAVSDILRSRDGQKQRVKRFQEVWRKIFGRPVDAAAAEAYLQVKARGARGTRRSKKQRGGAATLAGAPLDFQTRPGVDGVHGSFPQYVGSGLGFYNTVNQNAMFKGCGTQDISPSVGADMGSNKVGGGVVESTMDAIYSLTTRPFATTIPPSLPVQAQAQWLGQPAYPPSAPEQNPGLFPRGR